MEFLIVKVIQHSCLSLVSTNSIINADHDPNIAYINNSNRIGAIREKCRFFRDTNEAAASTLPAELMPNMLGAELILLQQIMSLFKGEVFLKRIDEQISIFGANRTVTRVHWVLMEWWRDGKFEANPAAVALARMRGRLGRWSRWEWHIDGDIRILGILSLFSRKVLKHEYDRLFGLEYRGGR